MAIRADDLQAIEALLARAEAGSAVMAELRRNFPHLKWSSCDASDVLEDPYRSFPAYDLHLMDASGHCPVVVGEQSAATGAIIAARSAAP